MNLQDRYKKIMENIAASAGKVRRDPKSVSLLAVTKTGTPDQIKQLLELGQHDFAESRVQQLQQRAAQLEEWILTAAGADGEKGAGGGGCALAYDRAFAAE